MTHEKKKENIDVFLKLRTVSEQRCVWQIFGLRCHATHDETPPPCLMYYALAPKWAGRINIAPTSGQAPCIPHDEKKGLPR